MRQLVSHTHHLLQICATRESHFIDSLIGSVMSINNNMLEKQNERPEHIVVSNIFSCHIFCLILTSYKTKACLHVVFRCSYSTIGSPRMDTKWDQQCNVLRSNPDIHTVPSKQTKATCIQTHSSLCKADEMTSNLVPMLDDRVCRRFEQWWEKQRSRGFWLSYSCFYVLCISRVAPDLQLFMFFDEESGSIYIFNRRKSGSQSKFFII